MTETDGYCLDKSRPSKYISLLDWMLSKPATGSETAETIAARMQQERDAWNRCLERAYDEK